jgi:hypothetical protein
MPQTASRTPSSLTASSTLPCLLPSVVLWRRRSLPFRVGAGNPLPAPHVPVAGARPPSRRRHGGQAGPPCETRYAKIRWAGAPALRSLAKQGPCDGLSDLDGDRSASLRRAHLPLNGARRANRHADAHGALPVRWCWPGLPAVAREAVVWLCETFPPHPRFSFQFPCPCRCHFDTLSAQVLLLVVRHRT